MYVFQLSDMTVDTYKSLCLGKAVHCLGQNYSELSDAIETQ